MADTDMSTDVITSVGVGAPPPDQACLMVVSAPSGTQLGEIYPLRSTCIIGRNGDADIRVEDQGVSRAHARIRLLPDGRLSIEDLDSRNGTFVNGVRMSNATLKEGDRIQIGAATVLRFSLRDEGNDTSFRLRQALSAARVATFQLDVASSQVRWSEQLDRMFDLPRGTFSDEGHPLADHVHPEDRDRVAKAMRDAVEIGRLVNTEFRLATRREDPTRWIACKGDVVRDAAGAAQRITGTVMDITERRRAEEELKRQALIFENLYDGVVTTDPKGNIVDWNASAERMFGHSKAEVLGETLFSALLAQGAEAMHDAMLQQLKSEGRWSSELEFSRKDGTTGFCEAVVVPLNDPLGKPMGFVATHRDISERKKLQSQLMIAERLASVGTLAAGVAHEINNPLAYITANLEFLLSELEPNPGVEPTPLRELLPSLRESLDGARRIATIVRDLKTFSRAEGDGTESATDVGKVVELAAKMANNLIRHRARLTLDCRTTQPVIGNEGRLCQVILNLLLNAADAMPETGKPDSQIHVTTRQQGELVAVTIQDNGSGMSLETRARIFDPFFTTKPIGVGTGLGLSICHGIITALGGQIEVESELGKGTTFTLLLKSAAEESVPLPDPVRAPVRAAQSPRRRVLVVDDELNVTLALQRVLGLTHEVASVNSAREALRLLESGERYDVILCDVMMPEMSGIELFSTIQTKTPEQAQRVVFMTGGAFNPKTRAQLDKAPNTKLTKPLDIQEVLTLVDTSVASSSIDVN